MLKLLRGTEEHRAPILPQDVRLLGLALALTIAACGGRTDLRDSVDAQGLDAPRPGPEVCNGTDDDLDGSVDEDFRDDVGRYVGLAHCGGCNAACSNVPGAIAVDCLVLEETPVCGATACVPGQGPTASGGCAPLFDRLCLPCVDDADCGATRAAACDTVAGEARCVIDCSQGCPDGYGCEGDRCVPEGGSCSCTPGARFDIACALEDPEGGLCPGEASCRDGVQTACSAPAERCD